MHNSKTPSTNTSGYKGVTWSKQNNKWMAQLKVNDKNLYLGFYHNIIDAALAYDAVARELHGEFARLNFPLTAAIG